MTKGPLAGVRIADFTQLYQGPLATQMLADMGAEVVKVEPPKGDFFRGWSLGDRFPAGESLSFLGVNRNKRSVVLDLKQPEGLEVARSIIAASDVVVENFRPGVMDRLGIGYDALSETNPGIVYCASSGYGQTGPYRDYPGQDLLIQALGGTLWLNGRLDDPPTAIGFGIADVAGGFHIVIGVLAALHEREKSGQGQRVDVNLLSSLLVAQTHELAYYANTADPPVRPRANTTAAYAGAPLGVYACSDGYLALSMMAIGPLARLVGATALEDVTASNDIPRRDEIHAELETRFRTDTRDAWISRLRAEDVWCAPVQTLEEALGDPQVTWNRMLREMDHPLVGRLKVIGPSILFSRTPADVRTSPPLLGQHTREVLAELGYGEAQVTALLTAGAAVQAALPALAVGAVGASEGAGGTA
jgi:crotonobetainyl-CoA:carnitine CoA-transferase CaiB-like acyl-CoA transferase